MQLIRQGRKTITAILCFAAVCASGAGGAQVLRPTGLGVMNPMPGAANYEAMDLSFSVCDSLEELPAAWAELMDDLPDYTSTTLLSNPGEIALDSTGTLRMGRWMADLNADMTLSLYRSMPSTAANQAERPSIASRLSLAAPQPYIPLYIPGVSYAAEESRMPLPTSPLATPEPGPAAFAGAVGIVSLLCVRRRRQAANRA